MGSNIARIAKYVTAHAAGFGAIGLAVFQFSHADVAGGLTALAAAGAAWGINLSPSQQ